jgi:hypothetical protein
MLTMSSMVTSGGKMLMHVNDGLANGLAAKTDGLDDGLAAKTSLFV